jgi:hypothetical protein
MTGQTIAFSAPWSVQEYDFLPAIPQVAAERLAATEASPAMYAFDWDRLMRNGDELWELL